MSDKARNKVLYFGFGANRDPKMISWILGRDAGELKAEQGLLQDFCLCIQTRDQVPDSVSLDTPRNKSPREILGSGWEDNFTSYVVKPKPGSLVMGTIWELTADERARIADWELVDYGWQLDTPAVAQKMNGQTVGVRTESIGPDQPVEKVVDGMDYPTWLHNPELFRENAKRSKQEYDKRHIGGYNSANA